MRLIILMGLIMTTVLTVLAYDLCFVTETYVDLNSSKEKELSTNDLRNADGYLNSTTLYIKTKDYEGLCNIPSNKLGYDFTTHTSLAVLKNNTWYFNKNLLKKVDKNDMKNYLNECPPILIKRKEIEEKTLIENEKSWNLNLANSN